MCHVCNCHVSTSRDNVLNINSPDVCMTEWSNPGLSYTQYDTYTYDSYVSRKQCENCYDLFFNINYMDNINCIKVCRARSSYSNKGNVPVQDVW